MSHDCQIKYWSWRFDAIFIRRNLLSPKIEFIDLSRTCCNLWSTKFSQNMSTDLLEKWELLRRRGSDAKSFKQRGNHWFLPLLTSTPLVRPRATFTEFFNTILEWYKNSCSYANVLMLIRHTTFKTCPYISFGSTNMNCVLNLWTIIYICWKEIYFLFTT